MRHGSNRRLVQQNRFITWTSQVRCFMFGSLEIVHLPLERCTAAPAAGLPLASAVRPHLENRIQLVMRERVVFIRNDASRAGLHGVACLRTTAPSRNQKCHVSFCRAKNNRHVFFPFQSTCRGQRYFGRPQFRSLTAGKPRKGLLGAQFAL
jgi:hypothetical protein